jgi:hypothetical protein
LFDADKSGSISVKELKQLFNKLDFRVSQQDLYKIMRLMDTVILRNKKKYSNIFNFYFITYKDGSGQVDFVINSF